MNKPTYFSGLDKTTITGFEIQSINFTKLRNSNAIIYYNNSQNFTRNIIDEESGELISISNISIEDNTMFTDLKIGAVIIKGQAIYYESLSLFVRGRGENNLIPSNMSFYMRNLAQVVEYLYSTYGIRIDTAEAKFQQLEYNATILIDEDFGAYERLLNVMIKLAPKTLKNATTYYKGREYTGNVIKNKSISYKFYNKTDQLNKKYAVELQERWLRLELAITNENKNSKEIFEKYLGSAKLKDITDRKLHDMFSKLFNRDFIKPLKDFMNKSAKDTYKTVKAAKDSKSKTYIKDSLIQLMKQEIDAAMPVCFDSAYFVQAIETLEKGNSHRARMIKSIEKQIPKSWIAQLEKAKQIISVVEDIEARSNIKLVAPDMTAVIDKEARNSITKKLMKKQGA